VKLKCRASSYVCNFANGSKGKFIKLVPLQILVGQCPRGPLLVQGNIQLQLIGELAELPIENDFGTWVSNFIVFKECIEWIAYNVVLYQSSLRLYAPPYYDIIGVFLVTPSFDY
jgi:hypothetical protein